MRVRVRDVCSSGYSWVRLKRDGDMMAGHRKRRKSEPLMSRSAMSSRPLSAQRTLQEAKISFNSRGKTLRKEQKSIVPFPLWWKCCTCVFYPPIGVNNLAEGQFTAHAEIGLVVREDRGWDSHRIHFTIFLWLIQGSYEIPYEWHGINHFICLEFSAWITTVFYKIRSFSLFCFVCHVWIKLFWCNYWSL